MRGRLLWFVPENCSHVSWRSFHPNCKAWRLIVQIIWGCVGGDAFFTVCLWRAGYAPTDPGYSVFVPEARVFDPFQWEWNNDNDGEARMLLAIEASKKGLCERQCQVQTPSCPGRIVASRVSFITPAACICRFAGSSWVFCIVRIMLLC